MWISSLRGCLILKLLPLYITTITRGILMMNFPWSRNSFIQHSKMMLPKVHFKLHYIFYFNWWIKKCPLIPHSWKQQLQQLKLAVHIFYFLFKVEEDYTNWLLFISLYKYTYDVVHTYSMALCCRVAGAHMMYQGNGHSMIH